MSPLAIDYRNATWADLQATVQGKRLDVLNAFRTHGPCTTRDLAEKTGMDILTIRPRTTELVDLGLVVLQGDKRGSEGIYAALSDEAALTAFQQKCADARNGQLSLL